MIVGIFNSKPLYKSILMSNDPALIFGLLFGLLKFLRGSIRLEGNVEEHAGLRSRYRFGLVVARQSFNRVENVFGVEVEKSSVKADAK